MTVKTRNLCSLFETVVVEWDDPHSLRYLHPWFTGGSVLCEGLGDVALLE